MLYYYYYYYSIMCTVRCVTPCVVWRVLWEIGYLRVAQGNVAAALTNNGNPEIYLSRTLFDTLIL